MPTYADVAQRLLRFESREFGAGATDSDIAAAEHALGVRIEGGYRSFLKQLGWGGVGHLELFGLGDDVPAHLELISLTRSEREEMQPPLRHDLIPVMNDGGGNLYCLDASKAKEPTIVFWDHTASADQEPEVEAQDFASWLHEQLEGLSE